MTHTGEPVLPPVDALLTIPEILDFHLQYNAGLPIYVFNRDGSSDVTEISFLEFGRACHRVAHLIRPRRAGQDKEVIAFIAMADTILYHAVTVGIMKAGLVTFPISPRNTASAVVHMLKKTSCHRLITTQVTLRSLIDDIKSELAEEDFELDIEEMPSLTEIYPKLGFESEDDFFEPYPLYTTRPPISEIAMYLHSSGSTGFPKSIPQSHEILLHWASFPGVVQMREYRPRVRIACMHLPPFHTFGIYAQVFYPLYSLVSIGMYPPTVTSRGMLPIIPNPENVLQHTQRTRSNAMTTVPALIQAWALSSESVNILKSLEFVGYSGGGVAPKLGQFLLKSGVKLNPRYGGTEFGSPVRVIPRKGDENEWPYMEFGERSEVRWVPQGDGTFECQFLVTPTHALPIENLSDVRGYATADLWVRHPTKSHLWKIVGRVDDVVIHSSGEKTVPAPMEDIVMSSPYVAGTVIFGHGHDQPGILIEPNETYRIDVKDQNQLMMLRNLLWPVIEEANKVAPAFSRIFKEMILITSKNKPLPRTGKGTVMRKLTLQAYYDEIEALYTTAELSAKADNIAPPTSWTKDHVQAWLLQQAVDIHPGKEFSLSTDLFEQGFDSLDATILRRRIVNALRAIPGFRTSKAGNDVTQNMIYSYPDIEVLSLFLLSLIESPEDFEDSRDSSAVIEAMVQKYSAGLEGTLPTPTTTTGHKNQVVLLTGSTGNLGSHILSLLLENTDIGRVYALNRPSSSAQSILERQRDKFKDKALDTDLLKSSKLIFIEGDIAQPNLGLPKDTYDELRNSITVIIHNAWRLDFNLSLMSFEPSVKGTRNLIDLARCGPSPMLIRFLFTSSVASAQSWDKFGKPFPEEVIIDSRVAVGTGYGESKYVSERILAKSRLNASSLRIGQLSGSLANGAWATTDWFPILVKSSLSLGALPSSAGDVSWLPIDSAAKAILDVALAQEQPPMALNLVHSKPVEWNSIITSIRDAVAREIDLGSNALRIMSFTEWFSMLEERSRAASDIDLSKIPAIKLLKFFQGMAGTESRGPLTFATETAQRISFIMREMPQIGVQDSGRWVSYWKSAGLFN